MLLCRCWLLALAPHYLIISHVSHIMKFGYGKISHQAMTKRQIYILWEESHLWGVLLLRTLRDMGLPFTLLNSVKISQGAMMRNPHENMLIAPGGNARLKGLALGTRGLSAISDWVKDGGSYLGFCGGAGLALSEGAFALNLCPWQRFRFVSRKEHLLSGPVEAELDNGERVVLPVWWPGRFNAGPKENIRILAAYSRPVSGLMVGSSPICKDVVQDSMFPYEQPLIISGQWGRGRYILSYAHLETPGWPEANTLLRCYLADSFNFLPRKAFTKIWNIHEAPVKGNDRSLNRDMEDCWHKMKAIFDTGFAGKLLYHRESWLPGWQEGIPGFVCTNLLASLHFLSEEQFGDEVKWSKTREKFLPAFDIFYEAAQTWFYQRKSCLPSESLKNGDSIKNQVFGHPMKGGGMAGDLLKVLDDVFMVMNLH